MSGRRAPDTLPNALEWAQAAACRAYDLDDFFTESKAGIARAKRICGRCPVREECLAEVLRAEDTSRYGIYGGLTPDERRDLLNEQARTGRKPAECGTRSAYNRHVKKGEPIDDACRAAKRASDRQYRAVSSAVP